ncbi:hypothetical protein [Nocardia crassostreae]|uniref:hypothetical protein n=1 Tax=Nocardia crassostreae TaxID=53428 RepID=UPI0012F9FE27|nr:hypothetical protein [Nocardia crassostreae]
MNTVVDNFELLDAIFKNCPWEPRELVETVLRQWLRCCGAAMRDGQVIGMPSRAVDEAWHGFILCTLRYERFCSAAYGQFLHHYPADEGSRDTSADPMVDQLGRTVVAWTLVARPGEDCVIWDLDTKAGVDDPWGIPAERVAFIESSLREQD